MSRISAYQHGPHVDAIAVVLIGGVLVSGGAGPVLYAQQLVRAQTTSITNETARGTPTSQDPLEKRVSIMLVDEPLSRALATIATQSGVRFTYSSDDLPPAKRVSLAERDVSVRTALQLVLAGTSLRAVAMPDGAVVLTAASVRPTAEAPASSETLVLTGRVIDPNGSPVRGAAIGLEATSDTTTTSDSGRFQIRGIVPGAYVLWARGVGFRARSIPITAAAQLSPVTVTLVPTVATLPTVTTTQTHGGYHEIGFDQRMRTGIGEFVTYEQITRDHATRLTEVLQRLRGVAFGELPWGYDGAADINGARELGQTGANAVNGMWAQGSCVAIAVNGVAQGVMDSRDIDNLIELSNVGAIEVYSASERPGSTGPETSHQQMPLPLVGSRDLVQPHCTLVVIWTRQLLGIPSPAAEAPDADATKPVAAPSSNAPR